MSTNFPNKLLQGDSVNFDLAVREKFTVDESFPFLISFPRTGSHWLRILMELYFEKPSLSRAFFYTDAEDFTCYHRHDEELEIYRRNVIYLYRDPVPTIYSQMNYYKEDVNDQGMVSSWAKKYGSHLSKWLIDETYSEHKTILSYEGMRQNINDEFRKITDHYDVEFDQQKFQAIVQYASKETLAKKSRHDKNVVNTTNSYQARREEFISTHKELIMTTVLNVNHNLTDYLTP